MSPIWTKFFASVTPLPPYQSNRRVVCNFRYLDIKLIILLPRIHAKAAYQVNAWKVYTVTVQILMVIYLHTDRCTWWHDVDTWQEFNLAQVATLRVKDGCERLSFIAWTHPPEWPYALCQYLRPVARLAYRAICSLLAAAEGSHRNWRKLFEPNQSFAFGHCFFIPFIYFKDLISGIQWASQFLHVISFLIEHISVLLIELLHGGIDHIYVLVYLSYLWFPYYIHILWERYVLVKTQIFSKVTCVH